MKGATFRLIAIVACLWLTTLSAIMAADDAGFVEILRARSVTLPVIEPGMESGSPKFVVVRLNAPPILTAGQHYGAVRIVCPPDKPLSLAWLFSDTMNIDEYDLVPLAGGKLEFGAQRHIYPATASADPDDERPGRRISSLPRPWDLFQLHLWSVPARLLRPGEQYLLWFRFTDRRPTDLLLAATFLDPAIKLDPPDLPPIFGLPDLEQP